MDAPPLVAQALAAYRQKGLGYVWYKILKRTLQAHPLLARHLLYRSPHWYWEQRGGIDYFLEQEAQPARAARSQFIAAEVARYGPRSLLEVGCGYGKQLASLRAYTRAPLVGADWCRSQLTLAASYLRLHADIGLVQADGLRLPFPDKSFDVVLTSAVLLHHPPLRSEAMRREICRIGRRLAIHNEDTDTSFSRFGLDTAAAYRGDGCRVLDCRTIPAAEHPEHTQFCVVDLASQLH
jgi:SAM-dependent methyltransferase